MINLKFYLDKRHLKAGNERPASIKIVITRKRTTALLSIGVSVLPDQWDSIKQRIINHPNEKRLNLHLSKKLISIQNIVYEMEENGLSAGMTAKDVKDYIIGKINQKEDEPQLFSFWFDKFVEIKDNERTIKAYLATKKKIQGFTKSWGNLTFEDMNVNWLKSFETFLGKTSLNTNGKGIHLRNIRAIFNFALSENVINVYPFKKFKIKKGVTPKRSFTTEQLRIFFKNKPSKTAKEGKDIMMLSFLLCGINFYDLINLTPNNIINGRIEYVRSKTKKFYSIKLEPEALNIIERLKGTNYLISIKDRYSNEYDALPKINTKIKLFIKECIEDGYEFCAPEKVSTYWARHSWATIAAELDIPKETIAAGLGHNIGSPITSIYIDFNLKKVDEANRKIIDYILYNKV